MLRKSAFKTLLANQQQWNKPSAIKNSFKPKCKCSLIV